MDDRVDVHLPWLDLRFSGKAQQVLDDLSRPVRFLDDDGDILLPFFILGHFPLDHPAEHHDRADGVVQLMGHARRQLSEGGHFLRLDQLSLGPLQLLMGALELAVRLFQLRIEALEAFQKKMVAHFHLSQSQDDGLGLLPAGVVAAGPAVQVLVGVGFPELSQNGLDLRVRGIRQGRIMGSKAPREIQMRGLLEAFLFFRRLDQIPGFNEIHDNLLSTGTRDLHVRYGTVDAATAQQQVEKPRADLCFLELLQGPHGFRGSGLNHIVQIQEVLLEPGALAHPPRKAQDPSQAAPRPVKF